MFFAIKRNALVSLVAASLLMLAIPADAATKRRNAAPTISGTPPASVTVGSTYAFTPSAYDANGDRLRFSISNKPKWATFSSYTGRLTGTPSSANVGTYSKILISVSDGKAKASLPAFSITVAVAVAAPANRAPTIGGQPVVSGQVGQPYSFRPTATDPDSDRLTFSIANRPAWATFAADTGLLHGTPGANDVGTHANIVISVTDGTASASLPAFSITVAAAPNNPPTISGTPATQVTAGQTYVFQPSASDPDGQTLRFAIANRPAWATFDTVSGRLSGTPGANDVGTYASIVISVTDGTASASLPAFSITVVSANRAPTIGGQPVVSGQVGQPYSFRPTATDPDGDRLTFSIANRPAWATFAADTGLLHGTPGANDVGTFANIVISVTDGTASALLPAFSITVAAAPNNPPTISGTPATQVTAGQAYVFQPSASDPDGQTLRFGIANRPAWATFDTVSGRLSGTPDETQAGSHSNIVISVSDGTASATLPAFSITVVSANRAPTIGGQPVVGGQVGQPYSFRPTATDPDGDRLTFSIANRPAWATFEDDTGMLYGTPGANDVGTYANIVISVSDGTASASLPAFSITVATPPSVSATLRWNAPTHNVDGTPLTDLAGYRVSYGSTSRNYTVTLPLAASTTSVVIEDLAPGTWYFAVKAVNSAGTVSDFSNEAVKVF